VHLGDDLVLGERSRDADRDRPPWRRGRATRAVAGRSAPTRLAARRRHQRHRDDRRPESEDAVPPHGSVLPPPGASVAPSSVRRTLPVVSYGTCGAPGLPTTPPARRLPPSPGSLGRRPRAACGRGGPTRSSGSPPVRSGRTCPP